jgi:hypothetical protein
MSVMRGWRPQEPYGSELFFCGCNMMLFGHSPALNVWFHDLLHLRPDNITGRRVILR